MLLILDIGGTYTKYAISDSSLSIKLKSMFPTPKVNLEELLTLVDDIISNSIYIIDGIAISSAGAVDCNHGTIGGSSSVHYLHGPNIKLLFQERYNVPVEIENDANCAALSEIWKSSTATVHSYCFVVIGTGIGGAIVKDGRLQKGYRMHGGEFGYTVISNYEGELESFSSAASTHNLVKRVSKRKSIPMELIDGEEVFNMAENGDTDAIKELERFYFNLAIGLFNIQFSIDPEVIILGGAVTNQPRLVHGIERALNRIMDQVKIAKIRPHIRVSEFMNDANLYGAAFHFSRKHWIGQS